MEVEAAFSHDWNDQKTRLALKTASASGNGTGPGFVWLGGFRSDMAGTKAEAMVEQAEKLNCDSLRFDYSGHGESEGEFTEGTISRWADESLSIIRAHSKGPQILVGSSMGAWIAIRVAQRLAELGEGNRNHSLLLVAPAPDFTTKLMEPAFSDEQLRTLREKGFIEEPSEYSDEPNIITKKLIDDGRNNQVMDAELKLGVPVHILQGMQDPDVPYTHAMELVECLAQDDVVMTLVKDGDHRLSRDQDIELLCRTMGGLVESTAQI